MLGMLMQWGGETVDLSYVTNGECEMNNDDQLSKVTVSGLSFSSEEDVQAYAVALFERAEKVADGDVSDSGVTREVSAVDKELTSLIKYVDEVAFKRYLISHERAAETMMLVAKSMRTIKLMIHLIDEHIIDAFKYELASARKDIDHLSRRPSFNHDKPASPSLPNSEEFKRFNEAYEECILTLSKMLAERS